MSRAEHLLGEEHVRRYRETQVKFGIFGDAARRCCHSRRTDKGLARGLTAGRRLLTVDLPLRLYNDFARKDEGREGGSGEFLLLGPLEVEIKWQLNG
jgi:hypothetical protein